MFKRLKLKLFLPEGEGKGTLHVLKGIFAVTRRSLQHGQLTPVSVYVCVYEHTHVSERYFAGKVYLPRQLTWREFSTMKM